MSESKVIQCYHPPPLWSFLSDVRRRSFDTRGRIEWDPKTHVSMKKAILRDLRRGYIDCERGERAAVMAFLTHHSEQFMSRLLRPRTGHSVMAVWDKEEAKEVINQIEALTALEGIRRVEYVFDTGSRRGSRAVDKPVAEIRSNYFVPHSSSLWVFSEAMAHTPVRKLAIDYCKRNAHRYAELRERVEADTIFRTLYSY